MKWEWPKWATRKNPWYTLALTLAWLGLGIYNLSNGNLFLGGIAMWICGVNTVYLMNPKTAPDSIL